VIEKSFLKSNSKQTQTLLLSSAVSCLQPIEPLNGQDKKDEMEFTFRWS
jgi:hypothetical protein